MDQVLQLLHEINGKLDRSRGEQTLNRDEVMSVTGCKSHPAQSRWNKKYGLKPYIRGRYRRCEVENIIARLRLAAP